MTRPTSAKWLIGWLMALGAAAFTPLLLPTTLWLLLFVIALVVGLAKHAIPLRGAVPVSATTAGIVVVASIAAIGPDLVNLILGGAALLGLALRSWLRRAVTVPNILVSGGFGLLAGLLAGIELSVRLRPETRGTEGESLAWAPLLVVFTGWLPLLVFGLGYAAILAARRWRRGSRRAAPDDTGQRPA